MKRLVLRAKLTEIRCIYFELTSSFQSFFGNNILYCESWTVKKAKRQRIYAFELWCWRRLLKVPLTERRSNQSVLREINPECPFEGLMLKLKLQYFGHLIRTSDSLEKSLMLGRIEDRSRRGHQWIRCLDGITDAMDMNLDKLREMVKDREIWHAAVHGVAKTWTWLDDWKAKTILLTCRLLSSTPRSSGLVSLGRRQMSTFYISQGDVGDADPWTTH